MKQHSNTHLSGTEVSEKTSTEFLTSDELTEFFKKFEKWNFQGEKVIPTTPVTYTLENKLNKTIQGKHYQQERWKSVFDFHSNSETLQSKNILLLL